jgi:hypothetical protein
LRRTKKKRKTTKVSIGQIQNDEATSTTTGLNMANLARNKEQKKNNTGKSQNEPNKIEKKRLPFETLKVN